MTAKKKVFDEKLKPLLKSLRTKKRFLKIKLESNQTFDYKEFSNLLTRALFTYLGVLGFGKAQIWILQNTFNYKNQTCIMKVSLSEHKKVLGVLFLITHLRDIPCRIKVEKVSATLKGVNS